MESHHHHNGDDAEREALRHARAARVRAARAFADLDQATIAAELGVSVITVKRMERGTRDISIDELHTLADLCHVPHTFMESGFAESSEAGAMSELRQLREELAERFGALADALITQEDARQISREALERLRGPDPG